MGTNEEANGIECVVQVEATEPDPGLRLELKSLSQRMGAGYLKS
jgi:hypothetical protein